MRRSILLLSLPFALTLTATACGKTSGTSESAGVKADTKSDSPKKEGETQEQGDGMRAELPPKIELKYPSPKTVPQEDDYHGTKVKDPFRWMEDLDSKEVAQWVKAENEVTSSYLEEIKSRKGIQKKMEGLWNYERYGVPWKQGSRYFFSKNDGLQNQAVYYWTEDLSKEGKVLLDPNTLSKDGTVAIAGMKVSDDGKFLAYALSQSGSDWQEWHVRDVATGKDTDDLVKWTKFGSVAWSPDGTGFYYGRYKEPEVGQEFEEVNYYQKLYYHELGKPQSEDKLVYERKDQKEWAFYPGVSEDGNYLIIDVSVGTDTRNLVFYKDLKKPGSKVVELLPKFNAAYSFVGNDGPVFWFRTDLNAPKGKLIAIDTRDADPKSWKELIPESKDTLSSVSAIGGRFVAEYLADAYSKVFVHKLDGAKEREIKMPEIGSAGGFYGKMKDKETFYSFSSFTRPGSTFRYDLETGESTLFREPKLNFDPERYETKQVFFTSKDGTKVPMFIAHKKGLELSGDTPTYLYAYGGFNISLTPEFSVPNLAWLEMGGVYAQPTLRGGGEYGEAWHQAGMTVKKQNVFDDFIAAAQWLIDNKYTSSKKLAIGGRSNGGLLVGAAMTQRPELFAAALPGVGVMDMLRFHKFTIGWAWVPEYGSSEDPEHFKALHAYSPYHNLKDGTAYPATMVTTADHDDRVVPSHSFKFAARLQQAHSGKNPVLIRVDVKAGHGAGKPTAKKIEEWSDIWGFLAANLEMELPKEFF